jgi:hypothetical protein
VLEIMKNFRRAQQGLGGNAAPVKADAAEMFALDDGGLEAKLRRANRRDIAAGPTADNENIVCVSHGSLSLSRCARHKGSMQWERQESLGKRSNRLGGCRVD